LIYDPIGWPNSRPNNALCNTNRARGISRAPIQPNIGLENKGKQANACVRPYHKYCPPGYALHSASEVCVRLLPGGMMIVDGSDCNSSRAGAWRCLPPAPPHSSRVQNWTEKIRGGAGETGSHHAQRSDQRREQRSDLLRYVMSHTLLLTALPRSEQKSPRGPPIKGAKNAARNATLRLVALIPADSTVCALLSCDILLLRPRISDGRW